MCVWREKGAADHSSKVPQVKNVMGFGWGWKEVVYGILVDCHGGLDHALPQTGYKKNTRLGLHLINILSLYDILHMTFDNPPGKRHVEALAEVPIGDGAEYLSQRFIIKGIDGDDIQVTSEAP